MSVSSYTPHGVGRERRAANRSQRSHAGFSLGGCRCVRAVRSIPDQFWPNLADVARDAGLARARAQSARRCGAGVCRTGRGTSPRPAGPAAHALERRGRVVHAHSSAGRTPRSSPFGPYIVQNWPQIDQNMASRGSAPGAAWDISGGTGDWIRVVAPPGVADDSPDQPKCYTGIRRRDSC